jgi:dTDP-4-dehydrorhamnose 3,5-epimerase
MSGKSVPRVQTHYYTPVAKYDGLIDGIVSKKGSIFLDERGYFYEKYNKQFLSDNKVTFVQENISKSIKGTIRGLHWQTNPNAQDKLVTCLVGEIFDVAVDLRKNSKTFGVYCYQILKGDENMSLWIPKGFAHGFQAITDDCIISYSVSGDFSKEDSKTINPLCTSIGIDWPIEEKIISKNDSEALGLIDLLDREIFF